MLATTLTNSTNVRNSIAATLTRLELALASALAPEKAVEIAACLFSTPPRFAHTSRELELLATATRYSVDTPHGQIAAWRFGRRGGEAIVHDRDDSEVGFGSGLALARAWKDARMVATSGLGHRRILRDPGVVQDAVDFIGTRVVFAPPPSTGEARAYHAPSPIV